MPNVDTLLRDHVTLQVDCIDRLYLNGYVPLLQRPENLWWYLVKHKGCPVPSPVLLKKWVDSFVADIPGFAARNRIPLIQFARHERKEDVARRRLAWFRHPEGVVLVGVAQEKVNGFRTYQKNRRTHQQRRDGKPPMFLFYRGSIDVNQYYFYILDRDFGLRFIKFSSYPPFNVRVWINGHEWAKRKLDHRGVAYEELDNGFSSCADPARLQRTCDALGPEDIDAFFRKWLRVLPHPFSAEDRRIGFRYQLSIMQMEVSTTQVFDRPIHGRQFFEEVIRDNLDIGRPDRVQLIFGRRITRRTPGTFAPASSPKASSPASASTTSAPRSSSTSSSRVPSAPRPLSTTPTTSMSAATWAICLACSRSAATSITGCSASSAPLSTARSAPIPSSASSCPRSRPTTSALRRCAGVIRARWPSFQRSAGLPSRPRDSPTRTSASGWGALYDAGPKGYTQQKMTYDLRRLRLKYLIQRVPKTHRYVFTPAGRRAALFLTKSYVRLVRPTLDRLDRTCPMTLRISSAVHGSSARLRSKMRRKKQGLPHRSNLPHSCRS